MYLAAILAIPALAKDVATAAIDCSSGTPDLKSGVSTISQDECRTQCMDKCANSVKTEEDLETCLTNDAIKGCLFQVSTAQERAVDFCVRQHTDADPTLGDQIAVKVHGDDLYILGEQERANPESGMRISEVTMQIGVKDIAKFKACPNPAVKIGVSTTAFDATSCAVAGHLSIDKAFTVSSDAMDIVVPVGDALKGLYGQKEDAVVVIQMQGPDCGTLVGATDVAAYFSISYKAGYIDASVCGAITDCLQCQVANCHWCSWSSAVDKVLPSWLPDWDWVDAAKKKAQGRCGLNSALCTVSWGKMDLCSGAASIARPLVVATAAATILAFV